MEAGPGLSASEIWETTVRAVGQRILHVPQHRSLPTHRCGGGSPSAMSRSSGLTNTTAGTDALLPYGCTAASTGLQHGMYHVAGSWLMLATQQSSKSSFGLTTTWQLLTPAHQHQARA